MTASRTPVPPMQEAYLPSTGITSSVWGHTTQVTISGFLMHFKSSNISQVCWSGAVKTLSFHSRSGSAVAPLVGSLYFLPFSYSLFFSLGPLLKDWACLQGVHAVQLWRVDQESEGTSHHQQLQAGDRGLDGWGVQTVLLHQVTHSGWLFLSVIVFREPTGKYVGMGNITDQLELKKSLQCKSFDWFIKNVAYDMVEKVKGF